MAYPQRDRSNSTHPLVRQERLNFEEHELPNANNDLQLSVFGAPTSAPAVQYGLVGSAAMGTQNVFQTIDHMTSLSNALTLDPSHPILAPSFPNFSSPPMTQILQGNNSHSFPMGLTYSGSNGGISLIQNQNVQMGYDQFSQVQNVNFQGSQAIGAPNGYNMRNQMQMQNQMLMPIYSTSFTSISVGAMPSSGQFIGNQVNAVPPSQPNPLMDFQTVQNSRSGYFNNNNYFTPNVSQQLSSNFILPNQNMSHLAPLYQAPQSSIMVNAQPQMSLLPPICEPLMLNPVPPRFEMGQSSQQFNRNHGSAAALPPPQNPFFNSQTSSSFRFDQHNQFSAGPSNWNSQYIPPNFPMPPLNQVTTSLPHHEMPSNSESESHVTILLLPYTIDVTTRNGMPSNYGQQNLVGEDQSTSNSSGSLEINQPSPDQNIQNDSQAIVLRGDNIQHDAIAAPVQQFSMREASAVPDNQSDPAKLPESPTTGAPHEQQLALAAPIDGVHASQSEKGKNLQSQSTGQPSRTIQGTTEMGANPTVIIGSSASAPIDLDEVDDSTKQGENATEPPIRRGPGRPPKFRAQENYLSKSNKGENETELAKRRGPGHPPKFRAQEYDSSNQNKGENETEPPKRRGRGRPRVYFKEGEKEETPNLNEEEKEAETPKRRRGRPRKHREQEGVSDPNKSLENAGTSAIPQEEEMTRENVNEENEVQIVEGRNTYDNAMYSGRPMDPHLNNF